MRATRHVFDGTIAGMGTGAGVRIVVGHWPRSPFGAVADVMIESPDGHRRLVAPTAELARFIAETYVFDEVVVEPVAVSPGDGGWTAVTAGPLLLRYRAGRRTWPGLLLRCVPPALARRPAWCTLIDTPARLLMPGVRTRGTAGGGRREWYGAQDVHRITELAASLDGRDLGGLTGVSPPVRFGFGSAPREPAVVRVTTTVEVPSSPGRRSPGTP